MAVVHTAPVSRPATGPTTVLSSVSKVIAFKLAKMRVYHDTCAELRALSDRELSDIGIQRGRIRQIAQEAAQEVEMGS